MSLGKNIGVVVGILNSSPKYVTCPLGDLEQITSFFWNWLLTWKTWNYYPPLLHKVSVRTEFFHVHESDVQMWKRYGNSQNLQLMWNYINIFSHLLWFKTYRNRHYKQKVIHIFFLPGLLVGNRVHGNCQRCTCT